MKRSIGLHNIVTRVWLYWHDPAQADSSAALVLCELVFGCQKAANQRFDAYGCTHFSRRDAGVIVERKEEGR
jgi:hypothetical protein